MGGQLALWLAVGGLLLAAVALVIAIVALAAVSRSRSGRAVRGRGGTSRGSGFRAGHGRDLAVDEMRRELDRQAAEDRDLRRAMTAAISRTATIRYDAFREAGGQLSSSTALLDAQGNGVVFTSINARSEARTYAKAVSGGTGHTPLSDEETEVIRLAMNGSAADGESAAIAAGAADPRAVRAGVLRPAARTSRGRWNRRPGQRTVL